MGGPLVSVIVPNFNHSEYLHQRIGSILSQSYSNIELILLDDCSTDNSREIIERYREHPKVSSIFYNTINSGSPFRQWAKGIEAAKGAYIWIAESDDWAEAEFVEALIPHLAREQKAVLAFCRSKKIDTRGDVIGIWNDSWTKAINEKKMFLGTGSTLIKKELIYSNIIPNASGVIFRKAHIDISFLRKTHMRLNGDWLFWIKLLRKGKIIYINQVLNNFRMHSLSARVINEKSGRNLVEVLDILKFIENNYPEESDSISSERKKIVEAILKRFKSKKPNIGLLLLFLKNLWPNYQLLFHFGTQYLSKKISLYQR